MTKAHLSPCGRGCARQLCPGTQLRMSPGHSFLAHGEGPAVSTAEEILCSPPPMPRARSRKFAKFAAQRARAREGGGGVSGLSVSSRFGLNRGWAKPKRSKCSTPMREHVCARGAAVREGSARNRRENWALMPFLPPTGEKGGEADMPGQPARPAGATGLTSRRVTPA